MPRKQISSATDKAIPAVLRKRFSKSSDLDRAVVAARKNRTTKLTALSAAHRRELLGLLGRDGLKEYKALKKRLRNSPRSVRLRATDALLAELGFDRRRAIKLHEQHTSALLDLFGDWRSALPIRDRLPPRCSPWVEYRPPFPMEFINSEVDKNGNFRNPVFEPYANRSTGAIGSSLRVVVTEAGDDDRFSGDYYTAFRSFHTTLATGPLEVNLDLEIQAMRLWGKATDEWGYSVAQFGQTASAWIRVMTVAQPDESQSSIILTHLQPVWGQDKAWSIAGNSGDAHTYRLKTSTSYPQGTIMILEVGVRNAAWFDSNDTSVDMTLDVDLLINRVRVRSCP